MNRHRIELFILDQDGQIVDAVTRLQWDIDDVLSRARALLDGRRDWTARQFSDRRACQC